MAAAADEAPIKCSKCIGQAAYRDSVTNEPLCESHIDYKISASERELDIRSGSHIMERLAQYVSLLARGFGTDDDKEEVTLLFAVWATQKYGPPPLLGSAEEREKKAAAVKTQLNKCLDRLKSARMATGEAVRMARRLMRFNEFMDELFAQTFGSASSNIKHQWQDISRSFASAVQHGTALSASTIDACKMVGSMLDKHVRPLPK